MEDSGYIKPHLCPVLCLSWHTVLQVQQLAKMPHCAPLKQKEPFPDAQRFQYLNCGTAQTKTRNLNEWHWRWRCASANDVSCFETNVCIWTMPLKCCGCFKAPFEVQYLFPGYEERLSKFYPNYFSLVLHNWGGQIQRKISAYQLFHKQ